MFGNAFGPMHLLLILAVILLIFGAAKLPALAKSMGQSARVFKGEMKAMKDDDAVRDASKPDTTVTNEAASVDAPAKTPGSADTTP